MPNLIEAIPENLEIVNKTGLTMAEITRCINTVIKLGKISKSRQDEPQYCFGTYFEDGVVVFADKNEKGQDRLIVHRTFNPQEAIEFIEEIRRVIKEYGFGRNKDGRRPFSYYDTLSRGASLDSIMRLLKRGEKFEKMWRELECIYGSELMSDIEEKYLRRGLDYETRSYNGKTIYRFR